MKRISELVQTIIGDYPGERQIRQSISCLYGALTIASVVMLLAVLSLWDTLLCVLASSIILLYGLLTFRNERISYNETGITLYNIYGKPFQKEWHEICKIDVAEEPLISRHLAIGKVLRIHCLEKKDTVIIYRYPYKFYIGINDFLSFADEMMSKRW